MVLPPPSEYALRSFAFTADWDRDETYDHALSDISSYVLRCEYRYGMMESYQEFAPPARMLLTLSNHDGDWSVAKSGATFAGVFAKGVLVRLRFTYETGAGTTSETRFIGAISQIQLTPGRLGENTATLIIEDPMLRLLDSEYHPPLLTDVTTDQALSKPFDDAVLGFPYPHSYWLLGVEGASELETTTTIFENTLVDFETGATTLAYVGDNADAGRGTSIQSHLRDVVRSEAGGKFFWNAPTRKFKFWNRNHVSNINPTLSITIDSWQMVLDAPTEYHFADDLLNVVEVTYELKTLGTPATILYTAPNVPITLQAGVNRKFTARYQDPAAPTARTGGINMIPPLAGFDYVANSASDGSGNDVTSTLVISTEFNASSATITLYNSSASPLYVTTLQLRGTPLNAHAKETATSLDGISIFSNGFHYKTVALPLIESAEFAQDYASTIVSHFKSPISRFGRLTRDLTYEPPGGAGGLLSLKVGSTFKFYDPKLEDSYEPYIVVGEEGVIQQGNQWQVTYVIEPIQRAVFWTLGRTNRSELGETTILAL